ncbi:MAG: anti-sigma factor antagonist [Clostridia bacterium]|nr:anti-sigma factor antagonist [Clostridia bacterium]
MEVKLKTNGNELIAELLGELDHHSAENVRNVIDEVIKHKEFDRLIIDMSRVSFMDSSGLGVLLGRYKLISAEGKNMSITGASRSVDRILRMSGVYSVIGKV